MNKPKILIIPARRHILEAYTEYIIRYLGNDFYFEMGYPPETPYHNIKDRVWLGQTSPLEKNPDDFDLIYPHFTTHFFLQPPEKYYHKMVLAFLEPGTYHQDVKVQGATNKPCEDSFGNLPHHKLRFGIDTKLFQPFPQARLDDKVHVGFLGNIQTPRRYMKELFMPLVDLPNIKLDIYPTVWYKHTRPDEIDLMGGQGVIDNVVGGDMWDVGLPNAYNRMDIYVRTDIDPGCQLSLGEAAACGIPTVSCDPGIGKEIADAGGGVYIDATDRDLDRIAKEIRVAIENLSSSLPKRFAMGINARNFILKNYTWKKCIPAWKAFFEEGLKYAHN
jgi:glycosyltransferase involved in cell wall biosynthesis